MKNAAGQDRRTIWGGLLAFLVLAIAWFVALKLAPTDLHQGEVYRIIYMHVPSAYVAFLSALVLLIFSLWTLFKRSPNTPIWSKACAEIGLVYTVITLITGSIWGRPTWGIWWTWDARLTTTLILALLYAGYLIFTGSLNPGPQRDRIAAALGVIIALDVPVIYQSVTWWRTLHQPPSLMRKGGSTMDADMRVVLWTCFAATVCVAIWLFWVRVVNLKLQKKIEQFGYESQS